MTATVRGVTPQHRGIVPPNHAAAVLAALKAEDEADIAARRAVAEALKAGGSIREVMKLTGLANETVQRWGREFGWPTPEQVADRERRARRAQAHRDAIAEADRRLAEEEGL